MRSVIIEAQTREEVMTEMEERMKRMEGVYSRRLMQEVRFCLFLTISFGMRWLTDGGVGCRLSSMR